MSWEDTNVEVQCRASCSYCEKTAIFWASTSFASSKHGRDTGLVVENCVPDGWIRGERYMTDTPDMRCDECSQKSHY